MDEPSPRTEADDMRLAIECLTIFLGPVQVEAFAHVYQLAHGTDGPGEAAIISGFLILGEKAMLELAEERGAQPHERRQKATDILGEWSRALELPE